MKSGFTLIEISLALLVASIGLLGVMGLFPAGIQLSKMSSDETHAALFAEQVLNGIRAQAATQRWDRISTGIDLPPPTPDVWADPQDLRVRPTGNNFETLRFTTLGAMGAEEADREPYLDFSIRYRLRIDDINSRRKAVYLDVRPGEYGSAGEQRFFMELYNHGQN
jgi:prepilin-type N-terminal cleavage/methylation domain-containing protein